MQLARCVSALEVLVSALQGDVFEKRTLDVLAAFVDSFRPTLRAPSRAITLGRDEQRRPANLVQHACHLLYRARNQFLRGKEGSERTCSRLAGNHLSTITKRSR
ncbi:MAG: hypothetical protein V4550_15695 [Gemmatimonadota bacterium]